MEREKNVLAIEKSLLEYFWPSDLSFPLRTISLSKQIDNKKAQSKAISRVIIDFWSLCGEERKQTYGYVK